MVGLKWDNFNKTVNVYFQKSIFREIKTTVKDNNSVNRENLHTWI
jgi:hypothetical protein